MRRHFGKNKMFFYPALLKSFIRKSKTIVSQLVTSLSGIPEPGAMQTINKLSRQAQVQPRVVSHRSPSLPAVCPRTNLILESGGNTALPVTDVTYHVIGTLNTANTKSHDPHFMRGTRRRTRPVLGTKSAKSARVSEVGVPMAMRVSGCTFAR